MDMAKIKPSLSYPIKGIIDGFQEDFKEIVEEFSGEYQELKLSQFFKYWNEKSFDFLFANRFDPRELLEAITSINQTLVKIVVEERNDSVRIVALYFILCLYVKQPSRFRRKIRLNCDDAISIQKVASSNTDAGFAFKQLKSLKAIDLVEERLVYGPSMLIIDQDKRYNPDPDHLSTFVEREIEPALNELENISESYEQIKSALRLDDYNDTTVEIQTNGTVREFIDRSKLLLFLFKAEYE